MHNCHCILITKKDFKINIFPLRKQYIFTLQNRQIYVNMTSSKGLYSRHHKRRFLHISLILKIHPHISQNPGTTAKGKKTNMDNYQGRALLTVETSKIFYCCIESPLYKMNLTHFVTELEKQEITVTNSPHS